MIFYALFYSAQKASFHILLNLFVFVAGESDTEICKYNIYLELSHAKSENMPYFL